MQMNQEVAEISSATIPDSFFQVPEGYREAPAAEMVRGTLGMKPAESAGAIAPAFEISDPNAPQDAAGLVRLGRLAHEKGRQAEGDAYYRKALEFGDNADTAPALMGLALGSIVKDRAAALSYLDRALRADVSGPTAGPALSWMAYAHESDDPQRAASLYEQALNLEPADSPTRALTLELLARFTTAQAGLGDDAGRAKALTEEAQRIRAQHVASLSKPRQVGGQEQRIGGGVAPPKLAAKVEPVYTQVARLLKISGAVVLTVVVDVDGSARDIRLVRGLGFGLDEAAVNAVSQWRFEPGARAGAVVPVMATIEVNFRLL
jgi:TonB family protein